MKLVVGLGNPGDKYENTRHNVGFDVAQRMAGDTTFSKSKSAQLVYAWKTYDGERIEIVKPQTFMNKSGDAVKAVFSKHQELDLEDLYVVHDDLDIPLGSYKFHFGKGPREHKGIKSIESVLKSKDFWRVRIGVDSREEGKSRIPGERYVLMKMNEEDRSVLDQVYDKVLEELYRRVLS